MPAPGPLFQEFENPNFLHRCLPAVLNREGYRSAAFVAGSLGFHEDFLFRELVGGVDFARSDNKVWVSSFGSIDERLLAKNATEWLKKGKAPSLLLFHTATTHMPYEVPPNVNLKMSDRYDMSVAFIDLVIKDFMRSVDRDKTIVVIVGDHGEDFVRHSHGSELTENQVHVPFIILTPQDLDRKFSTSNVASAVDIAPTILDLLGLEKLYEFNQEHSLLFGKTLSDTQHPRAKAYAFASIGKKVASYTLDYGVYDSIHHRTVLPIVGSYTPSWSEIVKTGKEM